MADAERERGDEHAGQDAPRCRGFVAQAPGDEHPGRSRGALAQHGPERLGGQRRGQRRSDGCGEAAEHQQDGEDAVDLVAQVRSNQHHGASDEHGCPPGDPHRRHALAFGGEWFVDGVVGGDRAHHHGGLDHGDLDLGVLHLLPLGGAPEADRGDAPVGVGPDVGDELAGFDQAAVGDGADALLGEPLGHELIAVREFDQRRRRH